MVEPDHPIGMVGAAVTVAWCIGTGQRQPVDRPVDAVEVDDGNPRADSRVEHDVGRGDANPGVHDLEPGVSPGRWFVAHDDRPELSSLR